jgi:hypothetical protein
MTDKLQRDLLENLPAMESDRVRLDDYKDLKYCKDLEPNIDII